MKHRLMLEFGLTFQEGGWPVRSAMAVFGVLEFERLLSDISAVFVETPADLIGHRIEEALARVIEAMDVDRGTLAELHHPSGELRVMHSWARFGKPIAPYEVEPQLPIPWVASVVKQGKHIGFSRPEELPPEAEADRQWLVAHGIRSHLSLPLVARGAIVGALSFASLRREVEWEPRAIERLELLARVFSAALERASVEIELSRALTEVRALKDRLERHNRLLTEELVAQQGPAELVGQSPAIRQTLDMVEQVAPTDATVLLLGETGTGKELVARQVHASSARSDRPLIRVDCTALPETLIESELFGHEKGAFTGALTKRVGRVELADGGTLFLDEIGELDLGMQSKLLRVLQEGEYERLGSSKTRTSDVRVVAATNRDLEADVAAGTFRSDLYYRLAVFPIHIPMLSERRGDVALLAWHFVNLKQGSMGRRVEHIPDASMARLESYSWPGNVRELENVIERALVLGRGPELEITLGLLPEDSALPADDAPDSLAELERRHITSVLESCKWKINGPNNAADRLELHPSTLRNRLKKLGISRPGN